MLSAAGTTRLLYRMSMDFLGWARYVPGIQKVWKGVAGQVGQAGSAYARACLVTLVGHTDAKCCLPSLCGGSYGGMLCMFCRTGS